MEEYKTSTAAQFQELVDHYGKLADSIQKKQAAEQARADAKQAHASKVDYAYDCIDIFSSIKAQLRATPEEYREFESKEEQLAFISLLGEIEAGEKGGLFRKGTPDYLLFRNLYGGEVGAAGFCRHCYQCGAENAVPELLHRYGISSVQDIEKAYGSELEKNRAYHSAVLAAEDEIHKRDVEWNDHVRNTVRGSNVMVAVIFLRAIKQGDSKEGRDKDFVGAIINRPQPPGIS